MPRNPVLKKRMKVHILQHTDETSSGLTMDWLSSRKIDWKQTRFFLNESLPQTEDFDFLVVCGGAMGAYEEDKFPWLKQEKAFIKKSIEQGKSVVGLCLGSQLIANALGAEVKKHSDWEIGWHDVEIKNFGALTAFQYHQDTFQLPARAERIATNAFCTNQGFKIGERILGVQFHPEATREWIAHCANDNELPTTGNVQTTEEILSRISNMTRQQEWFFNQLDEIKKKTI
jgi:GMP synthase-like glutamine amidotransferase